MNQERTAYLFQSSLADGFFVVYRDDVIAWGFTEEHARLNMREHFNREGINPNLIETRKGDQWKTDKQP